MIKLENCEVVGWEHAIRGMRNPKNSWDKSDSGFTVDLTVCDDCPYNDLGTFFGCEGRGDCLNIGPNDHKLMMQLASGGPVHAKYRRMITVYVDITAPLYWWKEFDTYKVGTVANSCSTMHKIHAKEFTLSDFSFEHLIGLCDENGKTTDVLLDVSPLQDDSCCYSPAGIFNLTVKMLNICRDKYLEIDAKIKNKEYASLAESKALIAERKKYWWQMIQLLPSSYMQKRTVMMSYEVLANIYTWRNPHKMDVGHWDVMIDWIESLPYSEIITGGKDDEF
jgi:hypothetical protein